MPSCQSTCSERMLLTRQTLLLELWQSEQWVLWEFPSWTSISLIPWSKPSMTQIPMWGKLLFWVFPKSTRLPLKILKPWTWLLHWRISLAKNQMLWCLLMLLPLLRKLELFRTYVVIQWKGKNYNGLLSAQQIACCHKWVYVMGTSFHFGLSLQIRSQEPRRSWNDCWQSPSTSITYQPQCCVWMHQIGCQILWLHPKWGIG